VLGILRSAETTESEIDRLNFPFGRGHAQRANAVANDLISRMKEVGYRPVAG
jgi:hypothetical protein